MPLTIAFNALVLQRVLFEDVICTIGIISDSTLYTVYLTSFLHLLLISWERYVAVAKWIKYKIIVTRQRVKKYMGVAWLSSILMCAPVIIIETVWVRHYNYKLSLDIHAIKGTFWVVCLAVKVYYYIKVYLAVRKWTRTRLILTVPVNALVKVKRESKTVYTTFWLTLFAGRYLRPSERSLYFVYPFARVSPLFREIFIFRWAETILQLNSLVNPLLYWCRNRRFREAALELLRCRKPQRIQPTVSALRWIRRHRYSVASLDVEELQICQKRPRLIRYESELCDAVLCSDKRNERPISAPSVLTNEKVFTQQYNKQIVTVQIEIAPRKKRIQRNSELPKDTTEFKLGSQHQIGGEIVRSTSLHANSFVTLTNCHQNAAEKNVRRSKSVPTLPTIFNASDLNELIVAVWAKVLRESFCCVGGQAHIWLPTGSLGKRVEWKADN